MSPRLGTNWKKGIPIEVLPMAAPRVLMALKSLGSHNPQLRSSLPNKAGWELTDNGAYIIDAPFSPLLLPKDVQSGVKGGNGEDGIWTVDALAAKLKQIVGVNETGIFCGQNGYASNAAVGAAQKPVAAYFGMSDGSVLSK
jgi:ribose 5-phosphate isomerase A